ncbi:MAG: DUF523 domain-containing protein [Nanoarchaeota archaeon]|nr:DUF523 domain-containing protein [Nanoarchaeota archaeon]
MKLVSACLAGINCKYNGSSKPKEKIIEMVKNGEAIPVCPEQLGGLTTPRETAEQKNERVFTKDGKDVTTEFVKGANEGLKIAILAGCKEAILKARSPSCGSGKVYDGSFSGKLIDGDGVFAALLKKNGIRILTEEEI